MTNLYGSVPYLTAHSAQADSSIAWMNSGDTWVDILNNTLADTDGTYVSFVSEAPSLEFFVFTSTLGPQRVQRSLADIAGYPYMPPAYSLGFHFSKWGNVNAQSIMDRNDLFTKHGFQVDVLWMDIDYTKDYKYFEFHEHRFAQSQVEKMNKQVAESKRRFVVITDPHIKVEANYTVFSKG